MKEFEQPKEEIKLIFENSTPTRFGDINKYKLVDGIKDEGEKFFYHNEYITVCDKERHAVDVLKTSKLFHNPHFRDQFKTKNTKSISPEEFVKDTSIKLADDLKNGQYIILYSLEKFNSPHELALIPSIKQEAMRILHSTSENP